MIILKKQLEKSKKDMAITEIKSSLSFYQGQISEN